MRCKIPEISWHNRDPVLSVDIQTKSGIPDVYRLASAGSDTHVLIWHLQFEPDNSDVRLELAADLARHQRAVNVVRFSPSSELLASGDDESVVFIWKQKADNDPSNIFEPTNDQDKEVWITLKILRGHMEDVYDLSWSPNSQFIVSGSVDNTAIIWDVLKGKSKSILDDHKGFVQGVAWDPQNQYIATLSTDRFLRIFDIQTKRVLYRINKGTLPVEENDPLHGRQVRFFHDDTLQTFFRRLSFTPDGKMLITPAGVTDYDGVTHPLHQTYIFSRYALRQPSIMLPCTDQYAVAIRCCPKLFRLKPYDPEKNPPTISLPYRMIFALATRSSVFFYDTQQKQPFGMISNIHYTRLTDVTWSSDGRIVIVSSTDGFCSLITFDSGDLGEEYEEIENNFVSEAADGDQETKQKKTGSVQLQIKRKVSTDTVVNKKRIVDIREPLTEKKELDQKPVEDNKILNNVVGKEKHKSSEIIMESDVPTTISAKVSLPVDIIIDKEILSSDEKFELPGKKSRPVTPIMTRRHPRTPTSQSSTSSVTVINSASDKNGSPLSSLKKTTTPRGGKTPTPIAIRRTPRTLLPEPPTVVNVPAIVEEAMDAWPTNNEVSAPSAIKFKKLPKDDSIPKEIISERTEDIRLVYEGTITESSMVDNKTKALPVPEKTEETKHESTVVDDAPTQKRDSSAMKTPRRVSLKTISTPKNERKKLLD